MQKIKTLTINGTTYALTDDHARQQVDAMQDTLIALEEDQQETLDALKQAQQEAFAALKQAQQEKTEQMERTFQAALTALQSQQEEKLTQLQRLAEESAPPVVCSASGKAIFLADAADRTLRGLTLYGRTDESLESAGTSGSIGVTVTGKNVFDLAAMKAKSCVTSGDKFYAIYTSAAANIPVIPGQTYTISAYVKAASVHTGLLTLSVQDGYEVGYGKGTSLGSRVGATTEWKLVSITFTAVSDYVSISTNAQLRKDVMVEAGSVATAYAPYTAQTFSVPTPGGLPGIPVETGGNYTDEAGQQWVCDEIDLARGVYVQRIGVIDSYAGETVAQPYLGKLTAGEKVLCKLEASVETPLEQTLSLHANCPDTGIFNDAGAGMAVTYVADTGVYIRNAFAAASDINTKEE